MKIQRLFLNPDEHRPRVGWRLLAQFFIMAAALVAFGVALSPLFVWGERWGVSLLFISSLVGLGGITTSVVLARHFVDRRSFASLGLHANWEAVRDLLFGFALTAAMMGLIYLIEWTAGWLTFEGFAWEFQSPAGVVREALIMLVIFVFVGWQEELVARGYWLQNLEEGLTRSGTGSSGRGLAWAVLISSLLFSLAHYGNPAFSWAALLGLLGSGYFLAYAYIRRRNLWLPIGLHIGWNFFEGTVFGFQVSGTESYRLILQSVRGPTLWTGGAFGPEAGLVLIPALLLGTLVIRWYTRNPPKIGVCATL
ncbi:MAG: CPBP family intramembrane metalloprotease [Chloroflexi bacterium]|nr:CPBP family intramembrane metalloprotease [Chloroflexota bacterium]